MSWHRVGSRRSPNTPFVLRKISSLKRPLVKFRVKSWNSQNFFLGMVVDDIENKWSLGQTGGSAGPETHKNDYFDTTWNWTKILLHFSILSLRVSALNSKIFSVDNSQNFFLGMVVDDIENKWSLGQTGGSAGPETHKNDYFDTTWNWTKILLHFSILSLRVSALNSKIFSVDNVVLIVEFRKQWMHNAEHGIFYLFSTE